MPSDLQREIEYHEKLYSGFAQSHFAKPAVRALRQHMVERILKQTGAGKTSRVLSLGCGIGDTELLLAPHVADLTGLDLSPSAIKQATQDSAGIPNLHFIEGTLETANIQPATFDVVIAIFFLHHLPDTIPELATQIAKILKPNGTFYSLDPSRYRLSGAIGELLIPKLMARYQSPNERQLAPRETAAHFIKRRPRRPLRILRLPLHPPGRPLPQLAPRLHFDPRRRRTANPHTPPKPSQQQLRSNRLWNRDHRERSAPLN